MSLIGAMGDMPQILTSNYGTLTSAMPLQFCSPAVADEVKDDWQRNLLRAAQELNPQPNEPLMANSTRRIVQVFIADPDINVPLDAALLYKSEPKFTDATDQELYFEVPIMALLEGHNVKRLTWLDKDASRKAGKDIHLEPAKIRDLKMVVVNIAQF